MFTGGTAPHVLPLRLAPASCEGSCTSQTAISQARKVPERSGTTQNVPNNSLINTF